MTSRLEENWLGICLYLLRINTKKKPEERVFFSEVFEKEISNLSWVELQKYRLYEYGS